MATATHEVVDFGPGPVDMTEGYPFAGTEDECNRWIDNHEAEYPNKRSGSPRLCIQMIPE